MLESPKWESTNNNFKNQNQINLPTTKVQEPTVGYIYTKCLHYTLSLYSSNKTLSRKICSIIHKCIYLLNSVST